MKKIKGFFESIDQYGIPISFRYQKEDNYSTFIGGIFSFIIIGFSIIFGIYYFIPYVQKKDFSLYYYITNLNETEEINLKKTKSALALRFDSSNINNEENYKNITMEDLLDLKIKYIFYTNNGEEKNTNIIETHNCDISDFYYNKNLIKSLDKNKLDNLVCLNDLNKIIKNRYQDKHDNFSYLEIDIEPKNDMNISFIKNYLLDNDCKVELYYIDVKIEVEDYSEPIKPFFNEIFLQLNPDFHFRMNTFFMNEYFESNDDLFFPSDGKEIINSLYSRTEQYFLNKESSGDNSFAKIYIRADTKKIEIRRRYQNLLEFFADTFSFWEVIFILSEIIFCTYNKVSFSYLVQHELFFFKEKENKYFNVNKKSKQIEKLIKLTKITDDEVIVNEEIKNNNIIETESSLANIEIPNEKDNNSKNNYYKCEELNYHFTRIVNLFKCKCCKCRKTKKEILLKKGEAIINSKLDVICFIKSMLSLDVLKNIMNVENKEIFKFLSIPILVSNDEEKYKYYEQHEHYSDQDFEHFNEEITSILKKPYIVKGEKILIKLSNEQLKKLC